MVGLADIPIVGTFVDKVSEYTVAAVFRGLKYMFCYKALVHQLNSETVKLEIEKDNMSRKVQEEKANGKDILGHVSKWQIDVEEIQKSTGKELSPSCSCIQRLPIPNPVSRFQIGRNAAKMAQTVAEITGTGKSYLTGEIAHLPPVINLPKSDTAFEEFQSRKDVYKKLYDGLVTENSPLTHGIYGMAGVGKTRIMEQLWKDALKNKIFDKVVRVDVGSENKDKIKLQKQIAGLLDCKLESEEVVERRASQLQNSLRNGGKILLILDDVWREIRLDDIIGTPFGDGSSSSKGSKILFTSREKEVCLLNKCEHCVEIKTLSPDEALDLFKKVVGPDTINSLLDQSLVEKVCDNCGQLPLLIHAVGKALKLKPHNWWKDAHDQLKKGKFEKISGVDPQVFTGIKLSIDYLQNDDAKSCLFLCSMFPEDAKIDIKMLFQLATGSPLITDGESRLLAMVDSLKISSLLLDSGKDDEIKVHDIIRDVARSIASTDSKYGFLHVTCKSGYFPSNANDCTGKFLRLDVETADVHFDENLVCADLHTLWLQCNNHPQQFSGDFFGMFVYLSFLMLQNVDISLEQFSLQPLANLRTLTLLECDIRKTDVSLFPKKLKTLCICYCYLPSPINVANLKYLRKLEIQHGEPILVMRNVISSLSSLEELHIPDRLIIEHENKYHTEPIAMEISKLTHLTSLNFSFYHDNTFQGTDIFSKVDRYNIFVGAQEEVDRPLQYSRVSLTRSIELYGNNWQPWEGLMARAEEVRLGDSDIDVISSSCNGNGRAFEDLKRLHIEDCNTMGHIASISQNEIQYSLQSATCFSKLTILNVVGCSKLKYLFCNNIAKSLLQLQQLSVGSCDSMEAIIMNEGGTRDGEIINFSNLKILSMSDMPRLASFYAEKNSISRENLANPSALFDGMVAFPSLEELFIRGLSNSSAIWGKDTLYSFGKLNYLSVHECDKLEIVFPLSVASDLTYLEEMRVGNCGEMREIIGVGEQVITHGILFPHLTFLELSDLSALTSFWRYHHSGKADACKVPLTLPRVSSIFLIDLPNLKSFFHDENFEFHMPVLKEVTIYECGLSTLFTFSMFIKFQLQSLDVEYCELLENIVEDLGDGETCDKIITLFQLTEIVFGHLPNLKSLFHNEDYEFHMPVIKKVIIVECGLSTLFTFSMFTNFQLENLQIRNCGLLEKIVEDLRGDETCDRIITLFQLTEVELANLPNLKSFFHNANYEFHMPVLNKVKLIDCGLSNALFTRSVFKGLNQLEDLIVCDCELLESIIEDARGDETLAASDKIVALNRLSLVHFQGLPKLKIIFCGATYECYMPALKDVTIVGCGLSILFTCSMFQEIRQLKGLVVSNCELLEHIVDEVGDDETSEMNGKSITFSKLFSITLESLPNLKSFSCTSSYIFNMPKLRNFKLIECPQIEYFSSSKTNTSLVRVTSDWCSKAKFQDLDDFIRQNHKRGSYLSDCVGETSYSSQDPGTQSARIEDEEPQETETESDTNSSD